MKNIKQFWRLSLSALQDKVKSLSTDLSDLEKELDTMKPPGRDVKTVRQQLDDMTRYYKRLERADDLVAETERAAEGLVDSGYAGDAAKTRDQVKKERKNKNQSRSVHLDLLINLFYSKYFIQGYVASQVSLRIPGIRYLYYHSTWLEQRTTRHAGWEAITLSPASMTYAHEIRMAIHYKLARL